MERAHFSRRNTPDGVLTVILKGQLRGRVFLADSEGRLDYGGYHQAMKWDIAFDPNAGHRRLARQG